LTCLIEFHTAKNAWSAKVKFIQVTACKNWHTRHQLD